MRKQNHNIHNSTLIWLENTNIKNFTNIILFFDKILVVYMLLFNMWSSSNHIKLIYVLLATCSIAASKYAMCEVRFKVFLLEGIIRILNKNLFPQNLSWNFNFADIF